MIPPNEALDRLLKGNRRFVRNETDPEQLRSSPSAHVGGQTPFAAVLGCSDSRVPPELVFDQGQGDLFVVRVAGNVATPEVVGSLEFAVGVLGARLLVVLGHSECGAVTAAVEAVRKGNEPESPNLGAIVDRIRLSVDGAPEGASPSDFLENVTRSNVERAMEEITRQSDDLRRRIIGASVKLVGAEYAMHSGEVKLVA